MSESLEEYRAITDRLNAMNNADLRDQFAMAALTSLVAHENTKHITSQEEYDLRMTLCAQIAYEYADAMLLARGK